MRGPETIDFDEQVDLYGPLADVTPPTMARIYEFGRRRAETLSQAVREVVEEWQPLQQSSAIILRSSGPGLQFSDMREIYRRLDFPRS